jgi:hypothetical protein
LRRLVDSVAAQRARMTDTAATRLRAITAQRTAGTAPRSYITFDSLTRFLRRTDYPATPGFSVATVPNARAALGIHGATGGWAIEGSRLTSGATSSQMQVVIDSLRTIARRLYPQAFARTDDSISVVALVFDTGGTVIRRTLLVRPRSRENELVNPRTLLTDLFRGLPLDRLSELGVVNVGIPNGRQPTLVTWAFDGPFPRWY